MSVSKEEIEEFKRFKEEFMRCVDEEAMHMAELMVASGMAKWKPGFEPKE